MPGLAEAHCNPGHLLRDLGEFPAWRLPTCAAATNSAPSSQVGRRGILRPSGWHGASAWSNSMALARRSRRENRSAQCRRGIELAGLCSIKRLHWAAVTFYEEAFVAQPGLQAANRYQAGAPRHSPVADKDRTVAGSTSAINYAPKALDWLQRPDAVTKQLEQNPVALGQTLRQWQGDAGLAGVRTPDSLARLPKAEQEAWQQLWADVATTLERVRKTRAPESKPE